VLAVAAAAVLVGAVQAGAAVQVEGAEVVAAAVGASRRIVPNLYLHLIRFGSN
jgi:hypothetical protein